MYVARDVHPEFKVMNDRCLEIAGRIVGEVLCKEIEVLAGDRLLGGAESRGKIYRLKEGVLTFSRHGQPVWFLEAGDLFGVELHFWSWDSVVSSDFAVRCEEFDLAEVLAAVGRTPEGLMLWTEYLSLQSSMAQSVLSTLLFDEVESQPRIKAVRSGETIIEQGKPADEVFTLVDGHADVFVDGVKVGEVLRDEIFGVLATLGGTARTASVVATQNSLVLALPREEFSQLIQSRPRLIVKLVEDMARAMSAVNARIVGRY